MGDVLDEQRKAVYEQLCISYRAIDDFRAKLLGFLPLATGTGVFLLFSNVKQENYQYLGAIGAFGFLITLGLFSYELYGIKKCHALIKAGTNLELSLRVSNGQFGERPREVLHVVNEPFAAGIIYPAVLGAWAYLALLFTQTQAAIPIAIVVFVGGLAGTLTYNLLLKRDKPERQMDASKQGEQSAVARHGAVEG